MLFIFLLLFFVCVLYNSGIGFRCDLRLVNWREVEILVDRMLYEYCFVVRDVVPNVVQVVVLMR